MMSPNISRRLTWLLIVGYCLSALAHPSFAADKQPAEAAAREARRDRPSAAEYLSRLQRTIDADRKQLDTLKCEEEDPQSEYRRAEAEFQALDAKREAALVQIKEVKKQGRQQAVADLEEALESLEDEWQGSRQRFDLAIEERKALREKASSLEDKIRRDSELLQSLIEPEKSQPPAEPVTQATKVEPVPAPASEPVPAAPPAVKLPIGLPLAAIAQQSAADAQLNEALLQAEKDLSDRQAEVQEANTRAESVAERLAALEKNMAIEQQLLMLAQAKAEQAQEEWAGLNRQIHSDLVNRPTELDTLSKKVEVAADRYASAQRESHALQERLNELKIQQVTIERERDEAERERDAKVAAAKLAQGKLEHLRWPFSLDNIKQWLLDHGPRLLLILLGTFGLHSMVKVTGRQVVQLMARTGSRGTQRERENRALTLVGVFRNVASLVILGGGTLMLLDETGIPILPLMGGAAVLGLAVAFGAQNLVRDYFSGFMVLLEDQYGINDVVRINDVAGAVEQITLRVTVLRDQEGTVQFIPHGTITRVSNMTHGWSRAMLEIGVSYKENPDHVMEVLMQVARDLRNDPVFRPLILDEPEMLGVDSFSDSAIVIKFSVKTHALKRWPVRRELLRRIKHRFDQLGIEIPFPHRTVFLHRDEADEAQLGLPQSEQKAA